MAPLEKCTTRGASTRLIKAGEMHVPVALRLVKAWNCLHFKSITI